MAERCGRDQECLCTAIMCVFPCSLARKLAAGRWSRHSPLVPMLVCRGKRGTCRLVWMLLCLVPIVTLWMPYCLLCLGLQAAQLCAARCPPRMHVPAATQAALGKVNRG